MVDKFVNTLIKEITFNKTFNRNLKLYIQNKDKYKHVINEDLRKLFDHIIEMLNELNIDDNDSDVFI